MMRAITTALCVWRLVVVATTTHAAPPRPEDAASHKVERVASATASANASDDQWVTVIGAEGALGVTGLGKNLVACRDVLLAASADRLETVPGVGVVAAERKYAYGGGNNLNSTDHFGDCEVSLEFLLGKGSNSGVKLQGRYEVQLYDSSAESNPSGDDCGGVYPHWVYGKEGKGIRYVDQGVPPLLNAAKEPGEWQTLRIVFKAPRFDEQGKKTENARFVSVVLNGEPIHQDVEVDSPTGNTASPLPEVPRGPLYLQMDHGAVAFRKVRVKPM